MTKEVADATPPSSLIENHLLGNLLDPSSLNRPDGEQEQR